VKVVEVEIEVVEVEVEVVEVEVEVGKYSHTEYVDVLVNIWDII